MIASLLGLLALVIAAVFAGAAIYINVAEQPARLPLAPGPLLAEWTVAYKHGFAMQAPLAILGFLCGAGAWWLTRDAAYAIGALAMIANWPWTLAVIMPLNNRLLAFKPDQPDAGVSLKALVVRWGELHAVRSLLGAVATIAFLWACLAAR